MYLRLILSLVDEEACFDRYFRDKEILAKSKNYNLYNKSLMTRQSRLAIISTSYIRPMDENSELNKITNSNT